MISGGGTGGHIYPAISIAQSLKEILSEVEILFVGAKGKMEMKKVPEAGFDIVGLGITGIQRKLSFQNLLFPFKLIKSIWDAHRLIKEFNPHAVIGVGGYASGPLLYAATRKKIPTLIQEQNSYAGLTNKWLAGKVDKICVAYEKMDQYFPAQKIVLTGNPVRVDLIISKESRNESYKYFELEPDKKTLLILGGSLGARMINESVLISLPGWISQGYQIIWQTGGYYFEEMKERSKDLDLTYVTITDFIRAMSHAYAVADLVVSRAGALSIAELMLTGKACILIPSPNVAEDHQTKNAQSLVENDAAVMVKDDLAMSDLEGTVIELMKLDKDREKMMENIRKMAKPNASHQIATEVIKLIAA